MNEGQVHLGSPDVHGSAVPPAILRRSCCPNLRTVSLLSESFRESLLFITSSVHLPRWRIFSNRASRMRIGCAVSSGVWSTRSFSLFRNSFSAQRKQQQAIPRGLDERGCGEQRQRDARGSGEQARVLDPIEAPAGAVLRRRVPADALAWSAHLQGSREPVAGRVCKQGLAAVVEESVEDVAQSGGAMAKPRIDHSAQLFRA